ncbi:MAG: hypothetical protein ABFC96_00075 [Thermoguttaceae bacterium]
MAHLRNGREVHHGYGTAGAIDDIMSRLETTTDPFTGGRTD